MSKRPDRAPTIIDVARLAGVSKTTVARVIAGSKNVSAESRRSVLRAVKASGYEQNRFALGLRTGRSFIIGLLIPDISNPYWADVARGAQDEAEPQGYTLLISNSDWDLEREQRHLQVMRQSQVDGIIINPTDERVSILRKLPRTSVLLGSSADGVPSANSIRNDVEHGVALALTHLAEHGHREIGIIVGRSGRRGALRFQAGIDAFLRSAAGRGVHITPEEGDYAEGSARAACQRFLKMGKKRPTAIFAANDVMALSVIMALREVGLSCPEDMSVIGMDGISAGAFSHPGLTTVVKSRYEMGRQAAAILIAAIASNGKPVQRVLDCQLLVRGSVVMRKSIDGARRPSVLPSSISITEVP